MNQRVNWEKVTAIKLEGGDWLPLREGTTPEVEVPVRYDFGHLERQATVEQRLRFQTGGSGTYQVVTVPLTSVKAVRESLG